jgi:HK97 family phage major capsid protein
MSTKQAILELRQNRVKLVADARKLNDKALAEKRELSGDEKAQWDQMMTDVDGLKKRIDQMEGQESADRDAEEDEKEIERAKRGDDDEDEEREGEEDEDEERDEEEKERASRVFGKPAHRRSNRPRPGGERRNRLERRHWEDDRAYKARCRRMSPEYRRVVSQYFLHGPSALNSRALQADSDIIGGYLVMPQEFLGKLLKFVDDAVYIRNKATKFTVATAQSLGTPSLDTDISDSDWTSELNTGNEDTDLRVGKRELHPHPLAKRIKVSNKLIRAATISGGFSADGSVSGGGPEGLVRDRMGYKFGVTEEKAFLTGNGVQKALGLYVASTRGISTGRDVTCGTTTNFTADGLIDVKYNCKAQYQAKGEWLVHRDGLKRIRQLKDGMGQYIWAPGLNGGEPDTLLDRPVNMSEFNPNTFTTGQYVILFGDLSFYWIADAEQMTVQRLVELYAESNQVGFIGRRELDGMPVLEEAFSRGVLA